jgi:hypothetical protein
VDPDRPGIRHVTAPGGTRFPSICGGRTAVAGAGFGTGFFLGAFRILTLLADPGQRAGLIAAVWIVFFLAFSVPVVIAGVATAHFGLHRTSVVHCAVIAVLAAAAAGSLMIRRHFAQASTPPMAQAGPR